MANVLDDIENGARRLLNAGIGVAKTIEEQVNEFSTNFGQNVEQAKKDAVKAYDDLVLKGAKDSSPDAQNIRKSFDDGVTAVRKLQAKVEGR